jgi:hypothetical protein
MSGGIRVVSEISPQIDIRNVGVGRVGLREIEERTEPHTKEHNGGNSEANPGREALAMRRSAPWSLSWCRVLGRFEASVRNILKNGIRDILA